jgi:tetratricopeptide (TPR) repeat protein
VFALVLLSSIPVTVARAKIWTDPVMLWSDEYRKSEGRCRTCRRELTRIQADAGDFVPALRMVQTLMSDSMQHRNTPALVAVDMALLYSKLGDYNRANRLLLYLTSAQPTIPNFWRELAAAQAARYDFDAAESSAKHALALMPSFEKAQIAIKLIEKLRVDVLKLNDPATSDIERATFYTRSGRISDAEPLWVKILANSASPHEVEAAFDFIANLGTSAAASLAIEQYGQRLRDFPELATQIREKHALHSQLARLQLLR